MRVARFWRMKQQNYRLSGFQYESGDVSLLDRPLNVDTVENAVSAEYDEFEPVMASNGSMPISRKAS